MTRKQLCIVISIFICFAGRAGAQTTIINPLTQGGFESGNTFALNGWTVVNTAPAQTNQWFCGTGATGFTGTRCAHIGTGGGNNNYNANSASVVHFYRNVTFPAGQPFITLSFKWKGVGESFFDQLRIFLVPTATTPVAGTQLFTGQIGVDYDSQSTWKTETITIPCSNAGSTQRLVFQWSNDGSLGTNPAAAIDDISLVSNSTAPPCSSLMGTGFTAVASLPYNSGAGGTCGEGDDVTDINSTVCGDPFYVTGEDHVWSFTPTATGQINIILSSPFGFYTGLMLYSGCPVGCSGGPGTCIAYAQDFTGDKSICTSVTAGTTYYIVLDSWGGCNDFDFLSISSVAPVAAGGTCATAVNIASLPYTATGQTTACMGDDYNNGTTGSCMDLYESGEDKVYKYVSPGSECIGIALTNATTYSIGYQVYFGCPGSGGTCIFADGGNNPLTGSVTLSAAGTYYIVVDTWAPPTFVNYDISITSFGSGPVNDLPCNAVPLTLSVYTNGDNSCSGGAFEPAIPGCWYAGVMNTVWYKFVCPPSGQIRVKTQTGSLTDTQIEVYSGICSALTAIVSSCNDNSTYSCNGTLYSEVLLTGLTAGATYYIRVDGVGNEVGSFTVMAMDGTLPSPPTTQDCSGAVGVCQPVISQASSYFGCGSINEIPTTPSISNPSTNPSSTNSGCLLASVAELNASWYLINITTNGNLAWTSTQNTSGYYDWALYNITNNSCSDIANDLLPPVRCNWNATSTSPTGMQSTLPAGGVAGNFESPLAVTAGQQFVLILSNYSGTTGGYTLDFSNSTAGIGNPPTVTWSGSTNTSWTVNNNWGACAPPVCGISANIAPAANQPILTANTTVKYLYIMPGASLTINPGITLTVCGDFTNFGQLNASPTSTIIFNNAAVIQNMSGLLTAPNKTGNLTIAKTGGVVNLLNDLDIGGNYSSLNGTSVFNVNGKYIKLAGNFSNFSGNTTITNVAGSTLEFNGTTAQAYTNINGSLTLNNVVMNHTSTGVTLTGGNSNMILGASGVLTLNSGKIITPGTLEVSVTNSAFAACTPGNATSFVQGNLRRQLSTVAGSYDLPVGEATKGYQRANVFFTTAPSPAYNLLAKFQTWAGAPPMGPLASECPNFTYNTLPSFDHGYWTINASTGTPTGLYTITLYNYAYTNNAGNKWTVCKRSPSGTGPWALNGTCAAGSTATATVRNGLSGFSDFATVQAPNPLPIELINFTARARTHDVLVNWTTATEINNDYFIVERSANGETFEAINKQSGHGTTSSVNEYKFVDAHPLNGTSYYRLSQYDFDGSETKSATVAVTFREGKNNLVIYPNPFSGNINCEFDAPSEGIVVVEVVDVFGRQLTSFEEAVKSGSNTVKFNLEDVPAGMYFLKIKDPKSIFEDLIARIIKD